MHWGKNSAAPHRTRAVGNHKGNVQEGGDRPCNNAGDISGVIYQQPEAMNR